MIDRSAYSELHKRTEAAYQRFAEQTIAAFEGLRKIDPELAQFAIHAYGRPEVIAISLAQPYGWDRKNIYARLAAGEREEVRNEMGRALHDIY